MRSRTSPLDASEDTPRRDAIDHGRGVKSDRAFLPVRSGCTVLAMPGVSHARSAPRRGLVWSNLRRDGAASIASIVTLGMAIGCGGSIDSSSANARTGDGGTEGRVPLDATTLVGLQDAAEDTPQSASAPSSDSAAVSDAGCPPTESILTCEPAASFAPCWTCGKQTCSSQLTACGQDASCNAAIAGALSCVAEGGAPEQCFTFAFMQSNDTALGASEACLVMAYTRCGCMMSQGSAPPDDVDADLPLCSCTTVPPYGNAMCTQTSSCRIPACPVAGSPCCTPAGLCGCAVAIAGGPDLTCN
jgi:hypothetical protein